MNNALKLVLVLTLLIITLVIPLGAFTRLSDSGLGCPDWPGCYGFLDFRNAMEHVDRVNSETPGTLREAHKTWPEMVHRYFASKLGLLILFLALGTLWLKWKQKPEYPFWGALPWVLFILVCFQGALGMWTVTMKLYPPTVVGHLYGGFLTFSLLVILLFRVMQWTPKTQDLALYKLRWLSLVSAVLLLVQIGLGGWMSANYAALVCTELPVCETGWTGKITMLEAFSAPYDHGVDYEFGLLSHDARVTIHVAHRIMAGVFSVALLALVFSIFKQSQEAYSKKLASALFALWFVQFLLGVSNVAFSLPLAVATAHNGVGALLLAASLYVCYLSFQTGNKGEEKV